MASDVEEEKTTVLHDGRTTKDKSLEEPVVVDKVNEETYCLYFPEDQKVAEATREEFKA